MTSDRDVHNQLALSLFQIIGEKNKVQVYFVDASDFALVHGNPATNNFEELLRKNVFL